MWGEPYGAERTGGVRKRINARAEGGACRERDCYACVHPLARKRLRDPHFLAAPVRIRGGKGGRLKGVPESRPPNRSAWRTRGVGQQLLHPRPHRDERGESK